METIDFNEVIKDNIEVVGGLLGNPIGISYQIGEETNLDELTPGIYTIGASHPTIPYSTFGTFFVIKDKLNYVQQILFSYNGNIFYRMASPLKGFISWRKITGVKAV